MDRPLFLRKIHKRTGFHFQTAESFKHITPKARDEPILDLFSVIKLAVSIIPHQRRIEEIAASPARFVERVFAFGYDAFKSNFP